MNKNLSGFIKTLYSHTFAKALILQAFKLPIVMDFGDNMMLIRKKKGLSQADLGKLIGTSGDVIGRYERGDIKPSIEVVQKIADALEVSIDYLVGKTSILLDKQTLDRIENIAQLPEEKRSYVFELIDMCLRDFKAKRAYAS